jgi:ketosteroid isomerase-like protein
MSGENVEAFKRGVDAYNRRDVEALLEELHPRIEWRPLLPVLLGGEAVVYRGHESARQGIRELEEAFTELRAEPVEFRDLGERVIAIGHLHGRGKESGIVTESPIVWSVDFEDGKVIRIREYLDPDEALEDAGLPK